MRWTNRKGFISQCAFVIKKDYFETKEWIEKKGFGGGVDVDIEGIFDTQVFFYAKDVDWCSKRQFNSAIKEILCTAYDRVRFLDGEEIEQYKIFLQRKINAL